jgi:hypothetical protein
MPTDVWRSKGGALQYTRGSHEGQARVAACAEEPGSLRKGHGMPR